MTSSERGPENLPAQDQTVDYLLARVSELTQHVQNFVNIDPNWQIFCLAVAETILQKEFPIQPSRHLSFLPRKRLSESEVTQLCLFVNNQQKQLKLGLNSQFPGKATVVDTLFGNLQEIASELYPIHRKRYAVQDLLSEWHPKILDGTINLLAVAPSFPQEPGG